MHLHRVNTFLPTNYNHLFANVCFNVEKDIKERYLLRDKNKNLNQLACQINKLIFYDVYCVHMCGNVLVFVSNQGIVCSMYYCSTSVCKAFMVSNC